MVGRHVRFLIQLICAVALLSMARHGLAQPWLQQPASPASAAESGYVAVGSARVRLPPGKWILGADGAGNASSSVGGPVSSGIQQKIFYQVDQGKLSSIISIRANQGYEANGWVVPAGCARRDVYYVNNDGEYPSHFDCLLVNHTMMSTARARSSSPLWQSTYDNISSTVGLPTQMIVAEYEILNANRGAFVAIVVFFNPELSGFRSPAGSWIGSPWQKLNADAPHRAYLDKVVAWAESYRPLLRAAWE